MNISQEIILGWSGYRLTDGDLSLGVTPDIGGRILSLIFRGEELLYGHAPEAGQIYDFSTVTDLRFWKKQFGFHIFGGDKTWVAPEKDWWDKIPPLEIDVGRYSLEIKGNFVVMVSLLCRETGLQITRRISLDEGMVLIEEEFCNMSSQTIVKGIWNVTQINKPFDVYIPAAVKDVRSYYHEDPTLPRFEVVPQVKGDGVIIPCRGDICYKLGAMVREGRAVVIKETPGGRVAWSRSFDIDLSQPYAHRSVVEVFNSSKYDYGELEIHSPLYEIAPGARVCLKQSWKITEVKGEFF
ncbi:MAG: hypothetical protein HQL21_01690 [Candidatus Omnitrophica bacterium]|nr:hypothetical protein [Candidatus Omnitrophota bacterium]